MKASVFLCLTIGAVLATAGPTTKPSQVKKKRGALSNTYSQPVSSYGSSSSHSPSNSYGAPSPSYSSASKAGSGSYSASPADSYSNSGFTPIQSSAPVAALPHGLAGDSSLLYSGQLLQGSALDYSSLNLGSYPGLSALPGSYPLDLTSASPTLPGYGVAPVTFGAGHAIPLLSSSYAGLPLGAELQDYSAWSAQLPLPSYPGYRLFAPATAGYAGLPVSYSPSTSPYRSPSYSSHSGSSGSYSSYAPPHSSYSPSSNYSPFSYSPSYSYSSPSSYSTPSSYSSPASYLSPSSYSSPSRYSLSSSYPSTSSSHSSPISSYSSGPPSYSSSPLSSYSSPSSEYSSPLSSYSSPSSGSNSSPSYSSFGGSSSSHSLPYKSASSSGYNKY